MIISSPQRHEELAGLVHPRIQRKTQALSSFFTCQKSLHNLEILSPLGYLAPEMERRRQLIRMRFGMQSGPMPVPVLDQASPDNLNPGFWKISRIIP